MLPAISFAVDNCCDTHGGEYACDYETSKLYCADGSVSTLCTCRAVDTPTPSPIPIPTATMAPSPTPLSCPALSTFDSVSGVCKCNAGYIANEGGCLSYTQYCWAKYGGNSIFDTDKKSCSCAQGYAWNKGVTSCVSWGELCQNSLGSKSYYNSDSNTCDCYQGYSVQNNQCQLVPTQVVSHTSSVPTPTSYPTPTPTPADIKIINPTVAKPTLTPYPTLDLKILKDGKSYISIRKTQQNGFIKILSSIWNFILHLI